jgi:hypothetical protein
MWGNSSTLELDFSSLLQFGIYNIEPFLVVITDLHEYAMDGSAAVGFLLLSG